MRSRAAPTWNPGGVWVRATPGRQRRASSQQDRLSGGARCRARQRGSTWVSRGLRGVGNPTPPQRLRTPSLLLGSRCKRQLAQGAQEKLQLALIRAGAVTPPALPAPSPPLDRPRGRGRGTGLTVGVLIGEGAGPTVDGVPTRDYVSGFRLRTRSPSG